MCSAPVSWHGPGKREREKERERERERERESTCVCVRAHLQNFTVFNITIGNTRFIRYHKVTVED